MFCSGCGAEIREGERFCAMCGKRRDGYPETPKTRADSAEDGAKPLYGYESVYSDTSGYGAQGEPPGGGIWRPGKKEEPPVSNGDYGGYHRDSGVYTSRYYAGAEPPRPKKKGAAITAVTVCVLLPFLVIGGQLVSDGIAKKFISENVPRPETDLREPPGWDLPDMPDWDFPDWGVPPDWDGQILPDGSQPREDAGSEEYDALLSDYFDMVSSGDSDGIDALLHPNAVSLLEREGIAKADFVYEVDSHTDNYGAEIEDYYVYGEYPYDNSRYGFISDTLDLEQARIERYTDVEVEVTLTLDGEEFEYIYDFDLIKVSGEWYLVAVW